MGRHGCERQQSLPLGEAEGSFQERRMLVEAAIERAAERIPAQRRLTFEQLVRYVFHTSERTGRPVTEYNRELAGRFFCSLATIKRALNDAEGIILRTRRRRGCGCWNDSSALEIDWQGVAGREPTSAHGEPTSAHGEPTSAHGEPTSAHGEPTSAHGEPPLKETQVSAESSTWTSEAVVERVFSLKEEAQIAGLANELRGWGLFSLEPLDRETILKTATLAADGRLSEQVWGNLKEAMRERPRNIWPWKHFWGVMRNQCRELLGEPFEKLLATTDFPRELMTPPAERESEVHA
jgi:hypothetical protein